MTEVTTSDATVAAQRRHRRGYAGWLVAAVVMVIATAIVLWIGFRRAAPDLLLLRFDVTTPPTGDPMSFALSPDGRQLVFVATGEKASQLWLRPLDQTTAAPLAGTDGANYPFWAPDSRAIGFFADGRLKRVDVTGSSTPQVLADAPAGRGGTWNRDGVIVFAPVVGQGLMSVSATGGRLAAATHVAISQTGHRWPQFLPDGRRFLFFATLKRPETAGVYVGSLDGGEPTRLLASDTPALFAPPDWLLMARRGELVAQHFDPTHAVLSGDPLPITKGVGSDLEVSRGAFSPVDGRAPRGRSGRPEPRSWGTSSTLCDATRSGWEHGHDGISCEGTIRRGGRRAVPDERQFRRSGCVLITVVLNWTAALKK